MHYALYDLYMKVVLSAHLHHASLGMWPHHSVIENRVIFCIILCHALASPQDNLFLIEWTIHLLSGQIVGNISILLYVSHKGSHKIRKKQLHA